MSFSCSARGPAGGTSTGSSRGRGQATRNGFYFGVRRLFPASHRRHIDGVLKRRKVAVAIEHPEKMPVQMQGVVHHGGQQHFIHRIEIG